MNGLFSGIPGIPLVVKDAACALDVISVMNVDDTAVNGMRAAFRRVRLVLVSF
jgi:hypothetical protein